MNKLDSFDMFAPMGWVCPVCGNVMAPSVLECVSCNRERRKKNITVTANTTIKPKISINDIDEGAPSKNISDVKYTVDEEANLERLVNYKEKEDYDFGKAFEDLIDGLIELGKLKEEEDKEGDKEGPVNSMINIFDLLK